MEKLDKENKKLFFSTPRIVVSLIIIIAGTTLLILRANNKYLFESNLMSFVGAALVIVGLWSMFGRQILVKGFLFRIGMILITLAAFATTTLLGMLAGFSSYIVPDIGAFCSAGFSIALLVKTIRTWNKDLTREEKRKVFLRWLSVPIIFFLFLLIYS
ncbi:MAG: hypothetical protein NUW02_02065 [Candidatus Campbellbacteria bacterium]|nr:hypothetical protein [Candidatus Campbellbacteria bacterium]